MNYKSVRIGLIIYIYTLCLCIIIGLLVQIATLVHRMQDEQIKIKYDIVQIRNVTDDMEKTFQETEGKIK